MDEKDQIIASILTEFMLGREFYYTTFNTRLTIYSGGEDGQSSLFRARKLTPFTDDQVYEINYEKAIELVNEYWGFYDGI